MHYDSSRAVDLGDRVHRMDQGVDRLETETSRLAMVLPMEVVVFGSCCRSSSVTVRLPDILSVVVDRSLVGRGKVLGIAVVVSSHFCGSDFLFPFLFAFFHVK